MKELREQQLKNELEVCQHICDTDDRSTEYMIQMMNDTVELFKLDYKECSYIDNHEFVMEFLYESRKRS